MKPCPHKSVTYETVLQSGQWVRATCTQCRRTGGFKPGRDAAMRALACTNVKRMVKQ